MHFNQYLKDRYHSILSNTGIILMIGGLYILSPLFVLMFWPEDKTHAAAFILPSAILITGGLLLWRLFRPRKRVMLNLNEGGIIVLLSWITVIFFSALPFRTVLHLSLTHSIFESVSAWTTTGLSVVDVTSAPRIILLWRSIMQLAGGAGFAIIMLSSIPRPQGISIISSEGRTDQLVPNVRESSRLVFMIYTGYVVFGITSYVFAGMSVFDAVNHTFAAVSTGGFSTYPDSIGHWDSFPIEIISILLMTLGNLNFLTIFLLLQGKVKQFFRNSEIRLFGFSLLFSVCGVFFFISKTMYGNVSKGFRVALFETVSALTTTGFTSVSYQSWTSIGFLILIILMLVGGGTCSTAGGIKQYRISVLIKLVLWEIRRTILPRTAVVENSLWQGHKKIFIEDYHVRRITSFTILYMLVFLIGSAVFMMHGYGFKESLFEFASSLGTVGLSLGLTSSTTPQLVLWTQIIGMLLGRMEFFIVITSLLFIYNDIRAAQNHPRSKG